MFRKAFWVTVLAAVPLAISGQARAEPQVAASPQISVLPADPPVTFPPEYGDRRPSYRTYRQQPRYYTRPNLWYQWYDVRRYPSRYTAGYRYYGPTYYGPTWYYNYGFPPYYYNYGWPGF